MNAYENKALELANWLETGEVEEIDLKESTDMLRQQAQELATLTDRIAEMKLNLGLAEHLEKKSADRIAELEKEANRLSDHANELRNVHADRIAELEKSHIELERGIVADLNQRQMAEPVAWMDEHENVIFERHEICPIPLYTTPQTKQCKDCGEINPAEIHTCSPQTKPLSDEEITQLAKKYLAGFSQYNCCNTTVEGEIEFARAIEERHGIK